MNSSDDIDDEFLQQAIQLSLVEHNEHTKTNATKQLPTDEKIETTRQVQDVQSNTACIVENSHPPRPNMILKTFIENACVVRKWVDKNK